MKIRIGSVIAILFLLNGCATFKEERVEEPPVIIYSEQEIKCLTDNAFFEARAEKHDNIKVQIVSTINRSIKRKLTFCETVYQRNSYSWTHQLKKNVRKKIIKRNKKIYEDIDILVRHVLYEPIGEIPISYRTDHYITVKMSQTNPPYWFTHYCINKVKVGNHVYCEGVPKK